MMPIIVAESGDPHLIGIWSNPSIPLEDKNRALHERIVEIANKEADNSIEMIYTTGRNLYHYITKAILDLHCSDGADDTVKLLKFISSHVAKRIHDPNFAKIFRSDRALSWAPISFWEDIIKAKLGSKSAPYSQLCLDSPNFNLVKLSLECIYDRKKPIMQYTCLELMHMFYGLEWHALCDYFFTERNLRWARQSVQLMVVLLYRAIDMCYQYGDAKTLFDHEDYRASLDYDATLSSMFCVNWAFKFDVEAIVCDFFECLFKSNIHHFVDEVRWPCAGTFAPSGGFEEPDSKRMRIDPTDPELGHSQSIPHPNFVTAPLVNPRVLSHLLSRARATKPNVVVDNRRIWFEDLVCSESMRRILQRKSPETALKYTKSREVLVYREKPAYVQHFYDAGLAMQAPPTILHQAAHQILNEDAMLSLAAKSCDGSLKNPLQVSNFKFDRFLQVWYWIPSGNGSSINRSTATSQNSQVSDAFDVYFHKSVLSLFVFMRGHPSHQIYGTEGLDLMLQLNE